MIINIKLKRKMCNFKKSYVYIISSPLFQILRENTINMGEEILFHYLSVKNVYILILGYLINI